MYDAFAKIDGNLIGAESGRDGDDLRIEKDEWLQGYRFVTGCVQTRTQTRTNAHRHVIAV